MVKNPPASADDTRDMGLISGSERSLEREMATRSSILAWRIPWTRSLVGYSPWSRKELDSTEATEHAALAIQQQG